MENSISILSGVIADAVWYCADSSYVDSSFPSGNALTLALARELGRSTWITRRDYAFNNTTLYWHRTAYDAQGRPMETEDSLTAIRQWLYKASEDKPGKSAPSSDDGLKGVCYISVPNVWIEADLLRGGGIYDHVVVNQGGTIGSFFGQTLGRWGYHTLKPGTPSDLLKTVNANIKDIYGLTVYAHGSPNGYIVAPDRKSAIHQTRLIAAFRSNGYRIARANMMQCYSIKTDGTIPTGPKTEKTYNYKEAWEKTAVKVYGYEGVNAIGIDFK